jgi:predicted Zn-dependent protease with MMP-like domain
MISDSQRQQFDDLLDAVIAQLPPHLAQLLEEVPVVVEDRPSAALLAQMNLDPRQSDLCGLHTGIPLTNRSVEHFREPIMRLANARRIAGGRFGAARERAKAAALQALEAEIRITLLHEMGHHFGLNEEDLDELGYG